MFNKTVHLLVERMLMLSKMHGTAIKKSLVLFILAKFDVPTTPYISTSPLVIKPHVFQSNLAV
jgi:hypothetical protein